VLAAFRPFIDPETSIFLPSAAVNVIPRVSSPVSVATTPVIPDLALIAITALLRVCELSVDTAKISVVIPLIVTVAVVADETAVIEAPETILASTLAYTPLKLATLLIAAAFAIALEEFALVEALSSVAEDAPTEIPFNNKVPEVRAALVAVVPPLLCKEARDPTPISLV